MMHLLLVGLLIGFTLCSSFFSLSQIALFSLPSSLISHYKRSPSKPLKAIASLLSHPHHLLITLIFCDIFVNIAIQNCTAIIFKDYESRLINVGVPLMITLIIGEILPKAIALPYNVSISKAITPIINFIRLLLHPILDWMIVGVNRVVQILVSSKPSDSVNPKELKEVLQSCKDFGLVSQEEGRLIHGYLSLNDCSVKERMKPRHEILFYDVNKPISELYSLFADKRCSLVPICNDNIQNILGICSAKSLVLKEEPISTTTEILQLIKKPYYIPETISAKTALFHLVSHDETMGIIIDEYGSIEGLITREDLFEIVTGEIIDQRDEKTLYTQSGRDVLIAAGNLELVDFNEIFNINLPTTNNIATIGGWLTEQAGTIPPAGTKIIWENLSFQILDSAPNRVRRVYIRKLHD
ncbi:hemolysin family protein [Chlamydiifrater phoenicopteri]|uniref:hemolysin family protein n=1 Tax=Chlamydiifrater phoenicopteri TaxID=2681469 RepID=UPI001BCA8129|nr:hemolysin family protein [Chlamydiifrater phoenicopteri]